MSQNNTAAFEQIIWPKQRLDSKSKKEWQSLQGTIKILCQLGRVTKWTSNCVQQIESQWPHVPVKYEIMDLEVIFSPNDSWVEIDGLFLRPPTNASEFSEIIRAIKVFRRLGKTFGLKILDEVYGSIDDEDLL